MTKQTRWPLRPAKTQISLGIRVFAVLMKKPWVFCYPLSAQRRLIRLCGCPGWSESSLGAHVILFVLSCFGSILTSRSESLYFANPMDSLYIYHRWAQINIQFYMLVKNEQSLIATTSDENNPYCHLLIVVYFCMVFYIYNNGIMY